jgi:hypothetical protein
VATKALATRDHVRGISGPSTLLNSIFVSSPAPAAEFNFMNLGVWIMVCNALFVSPIDGYCEPWVLVSEMEVESSDSVAVVRYIDVCEVMNYTS